MSVTSYRMKTHSSKDISDQFENINDCVVHNCKPEILEVVAGKNKCTHYIAVCKDESCGKIGTDGQNVVDIWNKWNAAISHEQKN